MQQEWVRSSSPCYRTFTLVMDRSLGFGSTPRDYSPYSDSVSLRLPYTVKLATNSKSLTHYTKGTQSPTKGSYCLYAHGFRVYFTPFTRVLFAFPSRYWFTIGRSGVFSLGGWSPHIQTGFHVPRLTHHHDCGPFAYRAITVYGRPVQAVLLKPQSLQGWSPFARHYWGNLG